MARAVAPAAGGLRAIPAANRSSVMRLLPALRVLLATLALALVVGGVLRLALGASLLPAGGWPWPMPRLLVAGAVADLATWCALLALPAALACFSNVRWDRRPLVRISLALVAGALSFLAVVEWYFAEEFSARFNHIAVDYLLYPGEVAGNLWQGYPLMTWALFCALLGTGLAQALTPWVASRADRAAPGLGARLAQAALSLGVGLLGLGWLLLAPGGELGDRLEREVAGNGPAGFVKALWTADLDYEAFYPTLPPDRIAPALARARGPAGTAGPLVRRPEQVVVLLEESLGAEFVGALGGARACTPKLDRWAARGLLFTHLVATGNRTVRGMEGVLASFPPLPPDSIVKRKAEMDLPTVARAFRGAGYGTTFLYGGAATFDHMGPWLASSGWDEVLDDGLVGSSPFPADAFRTAWGVADGPVLAELLRRQVEEHRAGRPFFATALTVSNHKPFLVPEPFGRPTRIPTKKLLRLACIGAAAVLVLGLGWWRARALLGLPSLALLSLAVLLGFSVLLRLEATAKGSRADGVAYADWAIGRYLDGLESTGLLESTLVLVVGDHGTRVYGSAEIPFESYRVPALFVGGGLEPGQRIERLCSQVDLGPTLLQLCDLPIPEGFFGQPQLGLPARGGRALLQHNRDIALLDDERCAILGLGRRVSLFERRGNDLVPHRGGGPAWEELVEGCQAIFQEASRRLHGRAPGELAADDGPFLR